MTADVNSDAPCFRRQTQSAWIDVRTPCWHWRVRPDVARDAELCAALRADIAAAGVAIKRGPHRTVRRLATHVGEYYVKQFHRPDWRTRLRHLLRGSQARWEWSRFQQAAARGVPTPDVVAVGRQTARQGDSGLITRGLPDAVPLDQWIAQHAGDLQLPLRRRLARELGEMIGEMHRHRVAHLDLHAGNVLIRSTGEAFQLWLVDLSPLRFRAWPLSARETSQNLGRLRHSLLRHLRATDEAAFFVAYCSVREGNTDDRRQWRRMARDMARRCDAVALACWEQMDRKWARGNRKTILLETPTAHCRGLAELGRPVLEALCADPDRLEPIAFAGRTVAIVTKHGEPASDGCNAGWARRGWETGHALHRRQIAAPLPLFMLEHRRSDRVSESLGLLSEPGWRSLPEVLAEGARRSSQSTLRRRSACPPPDGAPAAENLPRASSDNRSSGAASDLCDIGCRVAELLHRFQQLGFAHDALTLDAFEVRSHLSRWQVRFATLDAIRQLGPASSRPRWDDLRPLVNDAARRATIPRSLWLRWLLWWLPPAERADWRSAWRKLAPNTAPPSRARAA